MSIFKISQSPCPPGVLLSHFLWLKWCTNFVEMSSAQAVVLPLALIALNSDCWILSFPWIWKRTGVFRKHLCKMVCVWCPWSLQRVVVVMDDGGKQAWFLLNRALFTESHCWELVPTSYKYPLTILNCKRTPVLLCARHSPGAFLHSN